MSLATLAGFPGVKDINNQFNAKNIGQALICYNEQIANGGTYELGALTACFYKYPNNEKQSWLNEVDEHYAKGARDEFKGYIVEALTHTDKDGNPDPIPFTISWDQRCSGISRTYDPYTIHIGSGFLPPMTSALAERRERKP